MSDAACDERSEGTDGPFATQEKRSNERRRLVTSEAKGPTAPQAHAVCNTREAKQRATPSCDERSEGTDGATGTRGMQRKRSEAMSDAVMWRAKRGDRRRHRHRGMQRKRSEATSDAVL